MKPIPGNDRTPTCLRADTHRQVPDLIRRVRNLMSWTQAEMARWLGVHSNTVACWERGDKRPSRLVGKYLATILAQTRPRKARTRRASAERIARQEQKRQQRGEKADHNQE